MFDRFHLVLAVPPALFYLWLVVLPQAATVESLPPDYRIERTEDNRFRWCLSIAKGAKLAFCGEPQKSEQAAIKDALEFAKKESAKK